MSSAPPSRPWRAISVRLTVYYSAYFVGSVVLLLGLAYFLLSSSLQRKDREAILGELRELAALYRGGGPTAIQDLLAAQEASGASEPFVVRVLGSDHTIRFMWKPSPLALDLERLRTAAIVPEQDWVFLSLSGPDTPALEITSVALADGGRLEVGGSTADRDEVLRHFRWVVLLALVPVLVLGIAGGALLATSTLRPIRQILRAVRAVTEGQMRVRVPTRQSGDELDELIFLFNGMLERIVALVEGMRSALDNVAHELRTPIMRIRGTAELVVHSDAPPEVVRQTLGECLEELDQLLAMLNTLMDISEAEAGALKLRAEPVDLAVIIGEVAELYQYVAQDKTVTVSTSAAPDLWVTADRHRIRQVVANLLDNAIKYTPSGGRVEIGAVRDDRGAVIRIRDTGIGIPSLELPRIWQRLYRGEGARGQPGLGLGLSLVRAVVHAHHGRLEVSSRPGAGSEFTVIFPGEHVGQDSQDAAATVQLSKL